MTGALALLALFVTLFGSLWLSERFYREHLPRKSALKVVIGHLLLWIFITAISFVTPLPMPATLIFGLFYQPPDGHVDGLHLGLSLLLWLPVINAVLMLLLSPALLKLSRREGAVYD